VGYGDIYPKEKEAKIFTIIFVFVGIGMISSALGIVGGYVMDQVPQNGTHDTSHAPNRNPNRNPI